ncbi:MAG: tetratricopeptide repeat protein [Planctomycetes bacterium]|nr:tetratricopeptide repeat protein [Planctomycetota bacterium]MBL7007529.1 tetratricopeptide repeat protein [Planctomycetota bacterium]
MPQAEVAQPSSPPSDPAAFFAAPPQTPRSLAAARRGLMSEPATVEKFEATVREARAGGNPVAAAGSWVCGEYAKALDLAQGDGELSVFIRADSLLELQRFAEAADLAGGLTGCDDPVLASCALHALDAAGRIEEFMAAVPDAKLNGSDRAYFEARALEVDGHYQEACGGYEALLAKDASHFPARFRLARRSDLHGDDAVAQRHYEAMLEHRPIPTSALINLGVMYEDRNDFEKACGCYGAVLRRDPSNPLARLYFKDAHESLDMFYDEELEKKEDRLLQVLRTPISDFELSVRARNCLQNMDIRTLGDLVSHSEPELLEFKNFGETSLNEIKRVLVAKGLRLGMRRDDGSFIIPEEFEAEPDFDPDRDLAWLGELSDDQREALDLQISTLNLSVRCHRALVERLNLQRVSDILRYTEEDLLSMPNFGITSLNELTSKLTELCLRLRSGRGDEYLDSQI